MIIKVKVIDDNGQPKGRAYTYKSEIDVNVGDLVVADMAGKDKILLVDEINVLEEKHDFEIKTIKGLYTEDTEIENTKNTSLDFRIIEESPVVIKINFDELKLNLIETMEYYKNIKVTEKNLKESKDKQGELASTRSTIDRFRLAKKKELKKPIDDFEAQCKELISLIEEVEQPIKEGIKVFDDQKRNLKRNQAIELAKEVASEYGLNEKYADRLEILDKYCNLTAKSNEVKEDLISKAMTLKVEQDREEELIDIIKDVIDSENERINRKMKFEDFKRYIDRGMSAKDVIAEIKLSASRIYEAENPLIPEPIPEPTPAPISETAKEPINEPIFEPVQEEPTYYAVYRITGKHGQLLSVSKFLKDNGINYTVTDDGEI